VREAVGVEDDRDDVGRIGLVELDEPLGEGRARLAEALAQADEAAALGAQLALEPGQLGALVVEIRLDLGLARLQPADAGLQRADLAVVRRDLAREDALGPLALADLAPRGLDLLLDVAELSARRRRSVGGQRQ